ncbi:MAG: peptidylprolyl isomerase [Bacteroidales bacterium]|jgi:cyclophilin family peptidyl-prolyl cis-trans isomerase|nr:peptidylprolyl isomerase [Bacteroidales bacterium]MDI9576240.1 peptidylprolyl isomerase [Bacteroidota bacterium]MDD3755978.1 peptidylprolyl isomerase [Bacteroidales bacterium]MDY0401108.1 peptidylprolyl isomerase [Bacteroidales bacterium]HHW59908.1 peptidylprolyl isomerase [Bacteroidales bacterium]
MKSLLITFMIVLFSSLNYLYSQSVKIIIHTDYGDITAVLYDKTPLHKDNFIKLVESNFYDSLLFHRVIPNFMIQGGDPMSKNARPGQILGSGGPDYTIPFEYIPEYFHKRGAIAAARMPDNINPNKESNGSQFYIVQGRKLTIEELNMIEQRGYKFTEEQKKTYTTIGGSPHLDGEYTVFGEVVSGMQVVDKIANMQTDKNNRPLQDIRFAIEIVK